MKIPTPKEVRAPSNSEVNFEAIRHGNKQGMNIDLRVQGQFSFKDGALWMRRQIMRQMKQLKRKKP